METAVEEETPLASILPGESAGTTDTFMLTDTVDIAFTALGADFSAASVKARTDFQSRRSSHCFCWVAKGV